MTVCITSWTKAGNYEVHVASIYLAFLVCVAVISDCVWPADSGRHRASHYEQCHLGFPQIQTWRKTYGQADAGCRVAFRCVGPLRSEDRGASSGIIPACGARRSPSHSAF